MNHMGESKPPIDGPTVHWSTTDLTESFIFIRRIPRPYLHGLYGIQSSHEANEYIATFENDIREVFGDILPRNSRIVPRFYQVPPDAGPETDFIFTLAENLNSIVQTIETYLSLGAMLATFFGIRRRRDREIEPPFSEAATGEMYTGVRMVEAMCLFHAYSTYCDPATHPSIGIASFSRSVHVGDVDHPAPSVQYTITITIGASRYIYVTRATAEVVDHFRIEESKTVGLPRPNWLEPETGYLGDTVTQLPDRVLKGVTSDSRGSE